MTSEIEPLVLVVDDSDDNRTMYAEYLAICGFRVVEAVNGADAVEKATRLLPDLIVTDLDLPVMSGWDATKMLKENASTSHIPIVALSGHLPEAHHARARAVGFDAFLMKPCLPDALVEKLQELLALKRA